MLKTKDVDAEKAMIANPLLCCSGPLIIDVQKIEQLNIWNDIEKFYQPIPAEAENSGNNNKDPATNAGTAANNKVSDEILEDEGAASMFDIFTTLIWVLKMMTLRTILITTTIVLAMQWPTTARR